MLKRVRGEEGVTMLIAVMIVAIVAVLAAAGAQVALHSTSSSGNDRKRVQAVEAAEAGIDYFYSLVQSTVAYASLPCTPIARATTSAPQASYTVSATYYSADPRTGGAQMTCPLSTRPTYVLVHSVGKPSGLSTPTRTMESLVKSTWVDSGTFPAGAIYGSTNVNFNANTQVTGSTFNDADVYTNGNITVSSNTIVYGNLYAQGSVTMASNTEVRKDLWALGNVIMNGNSKILGSVKSSTGSITLNESSHVYGDATAAGAITAGSGAIDGYRTANVGTTASPPSKGYPNFTFVPSDWTAAGYTNQQQFTGSNNNPCNQAANALSNWTTGNLLLRLTSLGSQPCTLFPPSKALPGSLAVITDGPVTFNTGIYLTASGGNSYDVFFFVGLAQISGYCDFTTQPNSGIGVGLNALIYTPSNCAVNFNSNSSLASGQLYSGTVNVNANNAWNYKQILVPGTVTSGFRQDIVYKREVI